MRIFGRQEMVPNLFLAACFVPIMWDADGTRPVDTRSIAGA